MATTFGVMSLVGSNLMKLTDLVTKYIPNYDTNRKGNTTIANLLLHNSGLKYDYPGPLPRTTDEVWDYITYAKPDFPVGTAFQYSNLGFHLLSKIVANVSRKSFGDYFVQNSIFAGLKNTMFNPDKSTWYRIAPTEYDAGSCEGMQRLGRELSGEKSIRGWPISSGASVDIQDYSPMPTISPGSCESSFLRAKFQGNTPGYFLSQCATSLQLGSKVFLTRARWATVSALPARVQRCPTVSDMTVLQV